MTMREKIQYSFFSKRIAVFLIVPIVMVTSVSFPRPAHAAFLVPILVNALLLIDPFITALIIDATTCYINVVWGCSNTAPDGTVTVLNVTPSNVLLSANPSTIDSGQSSTLTWSSTNAISCTSMGGFSTGGATSGDASTGILTATQNYQIRCDGIGASTNSNIATVTVLQPTVTINAAPSRVVRDSSGNGATTISWNATNVNNCTITRNGVTWQTLTADASRTISSSGTPDTITGQTTYAISCTNSSSSDAVAASATQIVNVVSAFQEF